MKKFEELYKNLGVAVAEPADGSKPIYPLSTGSLQMDDILPEIVAFLRVNSLNSEVVMGIEKLFTFEETSEYAQQSDENPPVITPLTLRDNSYYGHAYIQDDNMSDAVDYFATTVHEVMNTFAPEGYYFGSHPASASCIGFYPVSLDPLV